MFLGKKDGIWCAKQCVQEKTEAWKEALLAQTDGLKVTSPRIKAKLVPGGKPAGGGPADCVSEVVELQAVNMLKYFWAMHRTLSVG